MNVGRFFGEVDFHESVAFIELKLWDPEFEIVSKLIDSAGRIQYKEPIMRKVEPRGRIQGLDWGKT